MMPKIALVVYMKLTRSIRTDTTCIMLAGNAVGCRGVVYPPIQSKTTGVQAALRSVVAAFVASLLVVGAYSVPLCTPSSASALRPGDVCWSLHTGDGHFACPVNFAAGRRWPLPFYRVQECWACNYDEIATGNTPECHRCDATGGKLWRVQPSCKNFFTSHYGAGCGAPCGAVNVRGLLFACEAWP